MKKFFAALVCGAVIVSSSLCLASVEDSKIALGNIYPGMSANELLNAFGQPNYRDDDDWIYQNFKVEIELGRVEKVSTYSDTIMAAGNVRVGQTAEALNTTYGKADKIDRDDDGTVEYEYFSNDRMKKIEFKVANGVIVKITCKLRDMD